MGMIDMDVPIDFHPMVDPPATAGGTDCIQVRLLILIDLGRGLATSLASLHLQ